MALNRDMPAGEEKEVTMTPATSTEGTRKRGRPRRNKTQRSGGEAVITKEETIITQKGTEPPKGIKVESQQVFKLVPKGTPSAKKPAPITATSPVTAPSALAAAPVIPTKVTILPKKRVQKITILGKTPKKPLASTSASATASAASSQAGPIVKQKITLPQAKKTRKQYKERKLRIEL
jgi:hypothetical protein